MRRKNYGTILVLILLSLSLGYALIQTDLTINGVSKIAPTSWNVYFDNPRTTTGSVTLSQGDVAPTINPTTLTEVSYTVTLTEPGDFYEFLIDVKNTGTLDAMIESISTKLNNVEITNLPAYMSFSVTYEDGIPLAPNHLLNHGSTETFRVRVGYRTDIDPDDLPDEITTNVITFGVTYIQKNSYGIARPVSSFANDSWDFIINKVHNGNISNYQVGDTKTIELGNSLGTHTLRIANKSTPSECSTTGFSQTACGFVLEFADIFPTHRMNLYTSGDSNLDGSTVNGTGNKGGWEYSDMRAYLNSTTYANESIDYSTTGIYSSLPEVLRNAIINTTVVSGHGSVDTTNFTTTDKLYLLSRREVWNDTGSYDTAQGQTRQLDYYESIGVTTDNYSGTIKQRNGSNSSWWLRSAYSGNTSSFVFVHPNGSLTSISANAMYGVSPAFRIA